jgi:ribosomal protein L11 methylase PrmA
MLDHDLGDLVTPGGTLILSGILAEQSGDVEAALSKYELLLIDKRQQGDWVALAAQTRLPVE